MATKTIKLAVLASIVAVAATGCGARHQGSGTNDGMKTSNYRPFQYGTGNTKDMRLGFDRYQNTDPNLIKDNDSMRQGLNRDNGITGFDQDGVNNWRDYKNQHGMAGGAYPGTGAPADGMHGNTKMEAAKDIANQLASIEPVKNCNVMLTDNNAYVAVSTKNGEDLEGSHEVKNRIAEQVKAMRPDVQNVHVSANPDFVSRINGYMQDIQAGKPVSGMMEEFNTMVQRMFPTNAAKPQPAPSPAPAPAVTP